MSRKYSATYRRRRKHILARDGRCQAVECIEARPEKLTIHHKRALGEGGSHRLKNMIALCWLHHQLAHGYYQGGLPKAGER